MKLTHTNPPEKKEPLYFKDINMGEAFLYHDALYIKTDTLDIQGNGRCVNLNRGTLLSLTSKREVIKVKAEILYTTI